MSRVLGYGMISMLEIHSLRLLMQNNIEQWLSYLQGKRFGSSIISFPHISTLYNTIKLDPKISLISHTYGVFSCQSLVTDLLTIRQKHISYVILAFIAFAIFILRNRLSQSVV